MTESERRELLNRGPQQGVGQAQGVPSADRKGVPLASGVLDYFPAALAEVARVSVAGNEKHNPGEPLHWSRGKSSDHADALLRHLSDRGKVDPDTGLRHSAEAAWRALALLQEELEAAGAPQARGAWPLPPSENTLVPVVAALPHDPSTCPQCWLGREHR